MHRDFPTPSVLTLWQALTSGVVLLVDEDRDGGWCSVNGSGQGFSGLFAAGEVAQRLAQVRATATLWSSAYRWSPAAQAWAVDLVHALDPGALQQPAGAVFPNGLLEAHRGDGLLAYAWWGHQPVVFDALQNQGLRVAGCTWGGRPLSDWIDDARGRTAAPQHRWACEMHARQERGALRALLPTASPSRSLRRL